MSIKMTNIGDSLPDKCPICGGELTWKGVDLVCENPDCAQKDYRDLECWMGHLGNIDNLGGTLKNKFMDEYGVVTVEDIYKTDFKNDHNCGKQKELFFEMINKLKYDKVNIIDALCALNIPRLGWNTAEKLANSEYVRSGKFMIGVREDRIDIDQIYDIVGNATGNSIRDNIKKLDRLLFVADRIVYPTVIDKSEMRKVAITGALSVKRSEFEKLLNDNGFVLSGIGKDTLCLITDNPNSGSSKNNAADKLGVPKMTEAEFRETYIK